MLTEREVPRYLIERKLLSPGQIVRGDLVVADASRRNRNFKVISEHCPSFLLKQGRDPSGAATVAREAVVYRRLSGARGAAFRRHLPTFYEYDPREAVLILELYPQALDLRAQHARRGRFSTTLAALIGDAIAVLHGLGGEEEANPSGVRSVRPPPGVLSIHRPDLKTLRDFSSANVSIIKIIQRFPEFCQLLDELRREWRYQTLVHHDLKWDNCLVVSHPGSRATPEIKLVDWEFADTGDPGWDVGSIFSDYLAFWLNSIPTTGEDPPEQFLELARYPLDAMQPAIGSFWRSYVRRRGIGGIESHELLRRAIRYGAARLIQSALEQMQLRARLTGNVVCVLQVSLNILQHPEDALVHLLGIPLTA